MEYDIFMHKWSNISKRFAKIDKAWNDRIQNGDNGLWILTQQDQQMISVDDMIDIDMR